MQMLQLDFVKYKVNSSGNITRLYCAVNAKTVSDDKALRINQQT